MTLQYRTGLPATPELKHLRGLVAQSVKRFPRHGGVSLAYQEHGGVHCLSLTPKSAKANLLYFHGGGFRLGSPELSAGFASHLAAKSQCRIILPFYRLAPEDPFPASLLDGQQVLESLSTDLPLLIGGDSAGGNLAAVLTRRFASKITGTLLLSPWLDLRLQSESYTLNADRDRVFSLAAAQHAADLYLQGHEASDPDVSPLLGELTGMPPLLMMVGSGEVLLHDALTYVERLQVTATKVDLHIIPDMAHVEPTTTPDKACTEKALSLAASFISGLL